MPEKPDDKRPQAEKFRDLARELGADDDEKAFEDKVRAVVAAHPKKDEPSRG